MISTKEKADMREIEALKNLAHFGFLTTKSLGLLTNGVEGESALKSAKRVIKRLLEKKEIIKRTSLEGVNCYVLTLSGARRVTPFCKLVTAKSGVELETRHANRQELIVQKLVELRKNFPGEIIGEICIKRNPSKVLHGLHGLVWDTTQKQGHGVFYVSSIKDDTVNHLINLKRKSSKYILKITLVSADEIAVKALLRKLNKALL